MILARDAGGGADLNKPVPAHDLQEEQGVSQIAGDKPLRFAKQAVQPLKAESTNPKRRTAFQT
ncbi:hypothetical protein HMP09_2646 [Sphingomonas sp. HMP9]|nr:hypothetical protein HMP09_2646 [Sphingomonas sp. HMP9]